MTTKKTAKSKSDELRDEYEFAALKRGVRGKYYERARQGTNLVLLDPDVARAFPTQEAVNEALRMLVKVAASTASEKTPSHGR